MFKIFDDTITKPSSYDWYGRARRRRNWLLGQLVRRAVRRLAKQVRPVVHGTAGLMRTPADRWRLQQQIRALMALTDRELADIGITRGGIEFAVHSVRSRSATQPRRLFIRRADRAAA